MNTSSCRYYSLERKLDAVNKEWLDEVGYIITPEEKKMFLDLPKAEKEDFKKEFWQRRDPDPYTEENEYKEIYYNRIEEANEQFVGETKPGYLTDRGRIYILFGPPMDRIRYDTRNNRCQETWYYGGFPVVFVDEYCTGKYYLVTYDLTSLRTTNLGYMHDLNRAQADAQQTIVGESGFMNFDFYVEDTVAQSDLVAGLVRLEIPLAEIWFKEKDGIMTTDIKVDLEIWDAQENLVWEYHDSLEVITNEDELQADSGKKYETVIPFEIDKDFESLYKGENRLFVVLTNTTGEHSLRKVRSFRLK
jgi:GWxTD domain-containing protein